MLKRAFDVVAAGLGLIVLSPVMLIIALLIKWRLGSPIIFYQKRTGWREKRFTLLKFRTMHNHTNENGRLLPDDERRDSVGEWLRRYSLDELPQLYNVIRGDLSLVGPRPLLTACLPYYFPAERRRHSVRPGLTGWAQVNGRNAISYDKRFELDLWYIDNQSFLLDMKILWRTACHVLRPRNVQALEEHNRCFFEREKNNTDGSKK